MSALLPESRLLQDLLGGERDATYRALSFIAGQGGSPIAPVTATPAGLEAQRRAMLAWLKLQPDAAALARGYERHCELWSPIWKD